MTGFLRLEHIQCILDRDKENDIVIEAEIMRASAQPGAGHWQGDCTRHRRSSYSEVCYIHSFIPFHFCTSVYLFHQKSIAYFHTLEVIIGKCARCCPRSWCRPATSLHIGAGIAFTQYWAGHWSWSPHPPLLQPGQINSCTPSPAPIGDILVAYCLSDHILCL